MGDPVTMGLVLGGVSLLTAGATTAVQVTESNQSQRESASQGRKQQRAQEAAERELAERQAQEDAKASQAGSNAAARQRALAGAAGGYQSTIKTTPLGMPGPSGGQKKALGL
jgi:hypothetical protein